MEFRPDPGKFEQLQDLFTRAITEAVMVKLVEAGLEGPKLEEATAAIAFSIASLIDDTTGIESDGIEVRPYLGFRVGDDEVVHGDENAYTHEFIRDALKGLFDG